MEPTVELNAAELDRLKTSIKNMGDRIDGRLEKLDSRTSKLEENIHELEKSELLQAQALKDLISSAVTEGIKTARAEQEAALRILEAEVAERFKETNVALSNCKGKVDDLEKLAAQKELEELKIAEERRKETKKHIRNTILAGIITFFLAIVCNSFVTMLASYLSNPS
jgi:hypothetical protein